MIGHAIPIQHFEIVRDQIANILKNEFRNQLLEFYDARMNDIYIYADRTVPIGKEESAIIIISLFKGSYDMQYVGGQRGNYEFLLRIMTNSPTRGTDRGDKLAAMRLQQIIGIVRYILMHPEYITLGFDPEFIEHTEFSNFQIYIPETETDATGSSEAQAIFKVRCSESEIENDFTIISDNYTTVLLGLTDLGYEYQFQES